MIRKPKNKIFAIGLLLSLLTASCGARNNPGYVSDGEETPGSMEDAEFMSPKPEDGTIAVADFHYVVMDSAIPNSQIHEAYAINDQWLYLTDLVEDGEGGYDIGITRKRISDGDQEKNYAVTSMKKWSGKPFLFADGDGNCYIYWYRYREDETVTLEKYGPDGTLRWSADYSSEELEGMGKMLDQGIVTADGRVFLYCYGAGGKVFSFQADGSLGEVYAPELESLEGVAEGKDGRVYGYCITGKEPLFIELGGNREAAVCPVVPLSVYSGYEDGLCLRTGEGMLGYDPETGEITHLWNWNDEYVQMDGGKVECFVKSGEAYMIYLRESIRSLNKRQQLTFASVRMEDSGNYPGKETITLAVYYISSDLEFMIQRYNRQSPRYRVEAVIEEDTEALEKKLLRGGGADLINLGLVYAENLARLGALEDLDPYYEKSEVVDKEDILESVRQAGTMGGKNVAVIPSFSLSSLRARGDYVTAKDWTVWKFLEMGQQNRMFYSQSPSMALSYCMGIRYGEHFIDYEKKECYFDGDEFRRILEACSKWEDYIEYDGGYQTDLSSKKGDWLFDGINISSAWDLVQQETLFETENYEYEGEDYVATLVGSPGWDGGEYELWSNCKIGINSASGNKEGAWDFLEYLLSEEMQSAVDWELPSRKEYMEDYLKELYTDPSHSMRNPAWAEIPIPETKLPTEEDIDTVIKMAESAKCSNWGGTTNPIWVIVAEEAGMYFAGDATLDETVKKIQNRMQMYLGEL